MVSLTMVLFLSLLSEPQRHPSSGFAMALISEYHSLSNTTLLVYGVGAYVLYRILFGIYLIFFHPLAKFPGPKAWAVSRIPWAHHVIKGDIWQVLDQLHLQYGPVVRIAPDEITTISPDAWKDLYVAKPLLPKDPYSQTPPLNGAHSLFTAADDTHKRIRGAIVNAFSDKALRNQSPIIEHHATRLIERIGREQARSPHGVINLQKLFGYATFDTITDLSFGESFDGLEGDKTGQENSMIQNFFFHAKFSTIRNCLTRFAPLDIFLGLFLLGKTRASRTRNWKNAVDKIERRLAKGDVRDDFLTPVVGRIDESGTKGITSKELTTNGLAFVIADCQLTTVALAHATYLLLRDVKQWTRLAEEVRGQFERGEDITVQSTQGMVYLEAVISETMRIRHPTPISLPRVLPKEGRVVGGVYVPGNTVVGINLQNIQTSPTLWVEPESFSPERFLPKTDERYDERFDGDVKEAFMPFSTGVRNCIGSKVFLAQARVFLARLVWTFDLEMQDGQDDWLDQKAFLVFEPKPLFVKLTTR